MWESVGWMIFVRVFPAILAFPEVERGGHKARPYGRM